MGDSLGILCCTRHCRRLEGERSSQVEVHRVQDSYCSQAGLRIPREVLLLVAGPGDRMEDIPGRELHSCLRILLIKSVLSVLTAARANHIRTAGYQSKTDKLRSAILQPEN